MTGHQCLCRKQCISFGYLRISQFSSGSGESRQHMHNSYIFGTTLPFAHWQRLAEMMGSVSPYDSGPSVTLTAWWLL